MKPARMPADLYDTAKVYVALAEPIVVLDLDDIGVRRDLAQIPEIAERMRENGLPDLDRSVLTGRHLAYSAHDTRFGPFRRTSSQRMPISTPLPP